MRIKPKIFLIGFILLSSIKGLCQKTDTLFLVNGDRLVGEIKKLQYRLLSYKVDGMGTLQIEWPKVEENNHIIYQVNIVGEGFLQFIKILFKL